MVDFILSPIASFLGVSIPILLLIVIVVLLIINIIRG